MEEANVLSSVAATIWVLVGILISLILPVAVKVLRGAGGKLEGKDDKKPSFGQKVKEAFMQYGGPRYLTIFLAAAFVAIVLVLLFNLEFSSIRDAAFAGFAWESFINKLLTQQTQG